MESTVFTVALVVLILWILFSSFVTVQQGSIAVTTIFGKYNRSLYPGLNFKIPVIEKIFKRISIQNRSVELEFQAITVDQANVYFKAMCSTEFSLDFGKVPDRFLLLIAVTIIKSLIMI